MSNHNHPQHIDPKRIVDLLTSATQRLDDDIVAALGRARFSALEKQLVHKPVFALSTGHGIRWLIPHSLSQWVATGLILVVIIAGGVNYWHDAEELEISHLDLAILTDELPMEVFVDL